MTKKPTRPPAYQWYPADYLADDVVSLLDNEAYGLFRRFYDVAWLGDGLPDDPAFLFAQSHCPTRKKFDQLWMAIAPLFPPDPSGRRRNPQQETQRAERRKFSRRMELAARKRWQKRSSLSNASALPQHSVGTAHAMPTECSLLFSSPLTSTDQDQEDQRAVRRALPARMALPVQAVRRHLLAACHRLLESGPPYLVGGQPSISELTAELKTVAVQLGATWEHARELALIVDVALAQRQQGQAVARYRAARDRRERRALRRAGGR